MNNTTNETQQQIATLNDAVRRSLVLPPVLRTTIPHRIMLTRAIALLTPATVSEIMTKVSQFDNFTSNNDPYQEHDFGSFEQDGSTIVWKFSYYDNQLEYGSPTPEDPSQTIRVLTVMLSTEY